MTPDLIILGCVAQKERYARAAQDLYTSPLWRARRGYAEARGIPWRIFSAKHGLILPTEIISPYDVTISKLEMHERYELAAAVARAIEREDPRVVEIHAGEDYCAELGLMLMRRGIEVLRPLEGLQIGEQLAWYAARAREREAQHGQLGLFGG